MSGKDTVKQLAWGLRQLSPDSSADALREISLAVLDLRCRIAQIDTPAEPGLYMTLHIWNRIYALPLSQIIEVLRYEERTRLPRSTRLVDPRAQLGLQPTSGAHAILHLEGDKALVVDRVGPILAHDRLDRQVQLLSLERL